MCVILGAYKERPSEHMVRAAWDTNSHGGGVAWRDGAKSVRFKKGLKLDEMIHIIADLPLPFVAHFRIASCGGQSEQLTHPFPVTQRVELELDSRAPAVLFHNGHWGPWKANLLDCALRTGVNLPAKEQWSDSRAMAFIAARGGLGILDLIDEKVIVLTPQNMWSFGTGWKEINGVYCSNDHFEHKMRRLERGESMNHVTHYHSQAPASMAGGTTVYGPNKGGAVSENPRQLGPGPSGTPSSAEGGELPLVRGGTLSAKALRRIRKKQMKAERKEQKEFLRRLNEAAEAQLAEEAEAAMNTSTLPLSPVH